MDDPFAGLAREADERDVADRLASFRSRFYLPDGVYLDGNSLGLLSHDAEASILRVLDDWKTRAIGGWTDANPPWFTLAEQISDDVAALLNSPAHTVCVTGSTTLNLHQLLATLYEPDQVILADALNFPSDIFALQSHLRLYGLNPETHLRQVRSRDGRTLDEADIIAALDGVQMVVLSSVLYASGQLLDMRAITDAARSRGVLIGWDLSHSIGSVPHDLDELGADFAFWCHYKYLNAGPGAVGGLYLHERHHPRLAARGPGLAGWWGSRKERQFDLTHTASWADGVQALQIGTPHLLSLAPLEATVRLHREAGMEAIRAKSLALTDFLRRLLEAALPGARFATPAEDTRRGGHVSLIHPHAASVCRRLRQAGIVPDFRPPDMVRLAPVALYTSFRECFTAAQCLGQVISKNDCSEPVDVERELVP